mgnify:CR=1 FL=1
MIYLKGNHPFIKLAIKLPPNLWQNIDCLIDTGFSGGLALPVSFKKYFPKNMFFESRFVLADGSEAKVETSFTTVKYQNLRKEIAVIFMGNNSEGLVGVDFLNHQRFCLDLKKRKVELY